MSFAEEVRDAQRARATGDSFVMGTVTQLAPLRVRLDTDSAANDITPVKLADINNGDRVWCQLHGTQLLVLAKVNPGLTVYPLVPNTVPGNWADYGAVAFGELRATVRQDGLVTVEGLLKPLVSGTMLTSTEYLVGSLPTAACPISPRGALYGSVSAAGPISVRIRSAQVYLTALQSNIPFTTATWFALNGSFYR